MKRTSRKDALRNIQKRIVSWFSMVTIVMIGTSIILGLYFSYASLTNCGTEYLSEHHFKDLDLTCSLGASQEDLDHLLEVPGVSDAEGVISVPVQVAGDGKSASATLVSASDRISVPYAVEGRLPVAEDECALCESLVEKLGVSVGEEVTLKVSASGYDGILPGKTYRMTGIVGHPDYITTHRVDFGVLPKAAFDTSSLPFDYTNLVVAVDHGDNYDEQVLAVQNTLDTETFSWAKERLQTLADDLDAEYEKARLDAESQLADTKKQIEDAQKEFDQQISLAESELEDAQNQLTEGREKARQELASAEEKIQKGESEYQAGVTEGQRQLEEAQATLERELADKRSQLDAGQAEIDSNERLLNEKEAEYQSKLEEYNRGKEQLEEAGRQYREILDRIEEAFSLFHIADYMPRISELLEEMEIPQKEEILGLLNKMEESGPLEKLQLLRQVYFMIPESVQNAFQEVLDPMGIDVQMYLDKLEELEGVEKQLEEGNRELEEGKALLDDGRRQLDEGWSALSAAKAQLAEGREALSRGEQEARAKLETARAEFEKQKRDGAKQLETARKTFETKKKEALEELALHEKELEDAQREFREGKEQGEKDLADAWDAYAEAETTAKEKLDEAKEQIEEAKLISCEWFIQTRNANMYYMEYLSFAKVLYNIFFVFTPIYAGIVVVVCFFTMAIIVEEQSKQIGTCKAFGMYRSEIREKYLIFGATAAFTGALIGIGGGFVLEKIVINAVESQLALGDIPHHYEVIPFVVLPLGAVLVTAIAVIWSAHKIISCSAVGLLSGNEPVKKARKQAAKINAGSVYFRLILNNFAMDLGRETVSVFVILVCCVLIGLGTTIKLGHTTALHNQVDNIFRYDLVFTMSETATDEERQVILEALKDYDHYLTSKIGVVIQSDGKQTLTELYCVGDRERFADFYALQDNKGENVTIPEEGMLISYEMEEKDGLNSGEEVALITDKLKKGNVVINGNFMVNVGKTSAISEDTYREVFGEEPPANTIFVKVNGSSVDQVEEYFSQLQGITEISRSDDLLAQKAGMIRLYTMVVVVLIAFSIMISFMVLLNLSNILVAHRMKELLTMRVNGFSNRQVLGYLVREILVTTSLGVLLGLLIGVPATGYIIKNVETNAFMFIRKTYEWAWVLALSCNVLFSLVINSVAFGKIGKVPLTDITKY